MIRLNLAAVNRDQNIHRRRKSYSRLKFVTCCNGSAIPSATGDDNDANLQGARGPKIELALRLPRSHCG